ncbi:MAG TPA: DUF86 domain-containing protein, partial [Candidatus Thermoplasmatota archaeon]|nr:DUF86 domain-containing protein [Candidatus Thermoplasmatota archaeon]
MQEADLIRLKHILDASVEIQSFIKDKTQEEFKQDRKLHLSVVHLLEIIGEAGNQISEEVKEQYVDIPWKRIIGMRNRLIHGYFDIDLAIVWKTATEDIPPLIEEIKNMISS